MPRLYGRGNPITSWSSLETEAGFDHWLACVLDYHRLIKLMHPHPGLNLLDIGCGDGEVLMLARHLGLEATGIETKPEAAAISQKNAPEARIVLGSPQAIPFDPQYFDLVTCFGAMDFFLDPRQSLREIYRVLKPGGKACIVLPNGNFRPFRHQKIILEGQGLQGFYPFEKWKALLQDSRLMVGDVRFSRQNPPGQEDKTTWPGRLRKKILSLLVHLFPKTLSSHFIFVCHKLP